MSHSRRFRKAYNGIIGFVQTGIANPLLKWEKSKTTEFGADMGFLDNKVYASVSYYNRVTDDKIASLILPTSSGITSIRTNNGSMRNRGVEVEVDLKVIQKKDLKWQIGINGAWDKNTILKLPYNGNEKNRQGGQQIYDPKSGKLIWVGGYQEGQEWGELFGFVSEGIIRTAEDLTNYNKIDLAAARENSTRQPMWKIHGPLITPMQNIPGMYGQISLTQKTSTVPAACSGKSQTTWQSGKLR